MELDQDRCYQIIRARDARFDGRFFTGVLTTGIYCRPICPARTPKQSNVRFFAHAAAAEAAGLRPCRRCRPNAAPGSPAWMGASSTVTRALRLIGDGALDRGNVEDLASRLGIGARQLRRLFNAYVGAGPLAVATTRRVHFARRLIDETALSMTEVAAASGFGSVRQFNDQIRATFGEAPGELRRRANGAARRAPMVSGSPVLELRLPHRGPFDWEALLRFLAPRAIPGVEAVADRAYRRTCVVDGEVGLLEVSSREDGVLVLGYAGAAGSELLSITSRVRRLFDLDADPLAVASRLERDPWLATLVRPGLRVPGAWNAFELAVRAVLGQQVSVRGATTLAGRLVRGLGRPLPRAWAKPGARSGLTHTFPGAAELAGADLTALGLTRARAQTVRTLAQRVAAGELKLDQGADLETSLAELQQVPGIGPWTAHYIAMRALGEPDAFPAGDLGLRRTISRLRDGRMPTAKALETMAERWRPWRAYAAMQLWSVAGTG